MHVTKIEQALQTPSSVAELSTPSTATLTFEVAPPDPSGRPEGVDVRPPQRGASEELSNDS